MVTVEEGDVQLCNLLWVGHNLWWHYRHTQVRGGSGGDGGDGDGDGGGDGGGSDDRHLNCRRTRAHTIRILTNLCTHVYTLTHIHTHTHHSHTYTHTPSPGRKRTPSRHHGNINIKFTF